MACSIKGGKIVEVIILDLKPYLYETIKGKRKRVSVMETDGLGTITGIKKRGINSVKRLKVKK